MNIEEADTFTPLLEHREQLGYVHLCDSNRRSPRHGHIPFDKVIGALREQGYTGYASMECFIDDEEDLAQAIKYLRAMS